MQAQAILGLVEGARNGYRADTRTLEALVAPILANRRADGGFVSDGKPAHLFGALAVALLDERVPQPSLGPAAALLVASQRGDGAIPPVSVEAPVMEGELQSTALAVLVLRRVVERQGDAAARDALARAVGFLEHAPATTTQDRTHRILGLAWAGRPVGAWVADLLAQQLADGSWKEHPSMQAGNPMATGQALYALKVARGAPEGEGFARGVAWLLARQEEDGGWRYGAAGVETRSKRPSRFAASMWAALGLGASYGPLRIRIQAPAEGALAQATLRIRAELLEPPPAPLEEVRLVFEGRVLARGRDPWIDAELGRTLPDGAIAAIVAEARTTSGLLAQDRVFVHGAAPRGALEVTSRRLRYPPRLLFMIDQSGSMRGKVAGKDGAPLEKMAAARTAVRGVLARLPAGHEVGIRGYGAHAPTAQRDCEDTHLAWKVEPLSEQTRQMLDVLVGAMRPAGMTPIALALERAAEDLAGRGVVILVSDGQETCKRDPCATARRLLASHPTLQIHTVGFDIARDEAARTELRCVASAGGGRFLPASGPIDLAEALEEMARPTVLVRRAGDGAIHARTSVGAPALWLEVGDYELEVLAEGQARRRVTIRHGQSTRVALE